MRKIILLLAVLMFAFVPAAHAAKYPTKAIQLVVPYNPGGGSDITARIFADAMKDILPQPVVVSNITGATGLTGAAHVLNSRPDGYTVFWEHTSLALTPMISNAPFRWTDYDLLCVGAISENVMIVRNDSPWKSVDDVTKAIKANPGKIRFAAAANGVSHFLYLAYAEAVGGLDAMIVPMTGDKPRIVAMLGNNCDVTTVGLAAAEPYVKSGDIRILGVLSGERSAFFPDIKTFKEMGMDIDCSFIYSVLVPKNTPAPVKQILTDAFKKAAEKPSTNEALKKVMARTYFKDAAEAKKAWQVQANMFERIAKANGMVK